MASAAIVAVLGGVAGGVLRDSGWAMLLGGILGAIVVGVGGIVATHSLKGFVYSFIAVRFVFLYGVGRKMAKPADKACRRFHETDD